MVDIVDMMVDIDDIDTNNIGTNTGAEILNHAI